MKATGILAAALLISVVIANASADELPLIVPEGSTGIVPEEVDSASGMAISVAPVILTPMPSAGGYDYYGTYRFALLPGNNWVNGMRIVAQQSATAYWLDINGDGMAEYSGTLNAGEMYELDVPTGTHLNTDKPVTVVQYDDSYADWDDIHLAPTNEWGTDYWYAGIMSYRTNYDYLLFTAATDNTVIEIDLNNDGIAEETINLNRGQVTASSIFAVPTYSTLVGRDPRAGAHIVSNHPIQVHAFASMQAFFGSAYTLLPTRALGSNYHVPFIPTVRPGASWDDSDKILIVAVQDATTVNIDHDNDGVAEFTTILNRGETAEYPSTDVASPFLMGTNVVADAPIGVVYSSPRGMQQWDGGAVQLVPENAALREYWNTVSWNTIKRIRPPQTLGTFTWPGEPDVILFAYRDGTNIDVDRDNDGSSDISYALNSGDWVLHQVVDSGEHFYSDQPFSALQTWYAEAGAEIEQLGYRSVIEVDIDIKPGSYPNCFNISGHGVIPVAVLGSDELDVTLIDPASLVFAGLEVRVKGNDSLQCSVEDVSGDFTLPEGAPDGYPDLVCQFIDDPATWTPDDGLATLSGNLVDGTRIEGSDEICAVP